MRRAAALDDGPNPTATPELLDALREKGVAATFFVIPRYVHEGTAPILRRTFEDGHAVALHSGDRWLNLKSPDDLARAIEDAAARVERFAGHRPSRLFRPHGGWRSLSMIRGLRRSGYRLVGWSWMGKIVVIHDGHHRNPAAHRHYAAPAVGLIVDGLRARGYELAPLATAPAGVDLK